MGYNTRNDEICDNVTRMQREWEKQRGALATVRHFNATLSAKGYVWFWPKIAAALTSKHHWLIINSDSCGTVVDLDLRVKPRDPEASVRLALRDVQCPRCNGHGQAAHYRVGEASVDLTAQKNWVAANWLDVTAAPAITSMNFLQTGIFRMNIAGFYRAFTIEPPNLRAKS